MRGVGFLSFARRGWAAKRRGGAAGARSAHNAGPGAKGPRPCVGLAGASGPRQTPPPPPRRFAALPGGRKKQKEKGHAVTGC